MRSAFFGIEIGRRALFTHQRALDVTGHNIANANTPGYSRQVVRLTETTPFAPPSFSRPKMPGMIGTGVTVSSIERMKNEFIEDRLRAELQSLGRWETRRDILAEVEMIMAEPSESGLRSALDAFWTSLEDLAVHPDQASARSLVKQRAIALADAFRHTYDQLGQLQDSINKSVAVKVDEVNQIVTQIAKLNDQIMTATAAGLQPNDLKDQRDLLIQNLSKLVDVGLVEGQRGDITVSVAGMLLVDGNEARTLAAVPDPLNSNYYEVQFASTGIPVQISSGELRGLLEMRDTVVAGYKTQVNALAAEVITQFNVQHQAGFDLNGNPGGLFFSGTDATDMGLDPAIAADVSLIAAAQVAGAPGDGRNATALANLKKQPFMVGGMSFDTYFQSLIAQLGVDSQAADVQTKNQEALLGHLEQQQQAASGVSLDEELMNLVRFQHGYNAAARVVSVMDEVIDTIINRLGAGR
ncbi:MAG: flagellar hook-associated protein FlgK [Bacillota bacterium]|nr:flagellar hook-associated protein FlgK [Bacillota bacterium]